VALDAQKPGRKFVLPTLVFGVVEVHRLLRELESLESYFRQANVRGARTTKDMLPKVSRMLDSLATENNCNLLMAPERAMLKQFLEVVNVQAPRVHVSFASDPSAAFTAKIVAWFRNSVHRAILVQVGLQPTIAAGCVVRTTNKSFDFSLRHHFDEQRGLLIGALEAPETAA